LNRRTAFFRKAYDSLPEQNKQAAIGAYRIFLKNPRHPGLRSHPLQPTKRGQHLPGSISVTITMGYRAIYVVQNGVNLWYWIGSHADI